MIRALERSCAKHGLKDDGPCPRRDNLRRCAHCRGAAFLRRTGGRRRWNATRSLIAPATGNAVDERRMDAIVDTTLKHGIANTPTIVTNQRMLCYRDFDAARRQPDILKVPPF